MDVGEAEGEAGGAAVRGPVVSNVVAGAVRSTVVAGLVRAGGSDAPEGTAGASKRGESVADSVTATATAASVQTGASTAASATSGHRDNRPRRRWYRNRANATSTAASNHQG